MMGRGLASACLAVAACYLLTAQAITVPAAKTAIIYTNTAVTGSVAATGNIASVLETIREITAETTDVQPSAGELAAYSGYIIYSANGASYADVEGLTPGSSKLADLTSYVLGGGALMLVNGASGNSNAFLPLIEAIRGSSPGCTPTTFAAGDRLVNRVVSSSNFVFVELKAVDVTPDLKLSGLVCTSGKPIYSQRVGKTSDRSAAIYWPVGDGAIVWVGADFTVNRLNGIMAVVVGGLDAPTENRASPPPPLPPPPPYRKPSKKAPSPPPPSPPLPPSPPPPQPPSGKPGRRKPPPPVAASPPPLKKRSPPPPADYDYEYAPPPPKRRGD